MSKRCSHCLQDLPIEVFGKLKASPDGLRTQCKPCEIKGTKNYRKANPEKVKAWDHAKYQRQKEKIKARARANYAKNPERQKANGAKWNAAHPEAHLVILRNAKARRRARLGEQRHERISARQYNRLIVRDTHCYLCGKKNNLSTNSIDHVTPLSKGGQHVYENLRIVHSRCNKSKGNRLVSLPFQWEIGA